MITEGGRHQELLDEAIALIARAVHDNQDAIRERIERESPWWVPGAVDNKIHQKIVNGVDRTLQEMRADKSHPLRNRFDDGARRLHREAQRLAGGPSARRVAQAGAAGRCRRPPFLDRGVGGGEGGALSLCRATGGLRARRDRARVGRLRRDREHGPGAARASSTATSPTSPSGSVERYQGEVAALIAQTVAGWDPDATSQRIELAIGKDLQFIRINGTLVGGLAGLAIYYIAKLF